MKIIKISLFLFLVFTSLIPLAQVGIGTTTPKTTLQVKGDPANPYRADGIQIPTLSLGQLNAKFSSVYNYEQDGALIYINDVNVTSTASTTAAITTKGFYYYDSSINKFKMVGDSPNTTPTSYSVGDSAQGGIVFWVDETGQHGLVVETQDQGISNWYGAQDLISDPSNHSTNGQKYRDWRLPTKYELNEMYLFAGGFTTFFSNVYYWSSTEGHITDKAWMQNQTIGEQVLFGKLATRTIRAIRKF